MIRKRKRVVTRTGILAVVAVLAGLAALGAGAYSSYLMFVRNPGGDRTKTSDAQLRLARVSDSAAGPVTNGGRAIAYRPHEAIDVSGFSVVGPSLRPWGADASLETIGESCKNAGYKLAEMLAKNLDEARNRKDPREIVALLMTKAQIFNYEGEPNRSYEIAQEARSLASTDDQVASEWLYTIIYFQGVTALRRGETENCIMCRGESSCILPVAPAAVHTKPEGSRLAIRHFSEYLQQFPDDLGVRWLLNLAYMTLGEHPDKVDPRFVISLDRYRNSEFDIGNFRDIGHLVGLDRFNQAGGAIMEDFDNDGLLDIFVSCFDSTLSAAYYRNRGDGTFVDRSNETGVTGQRGGLVCYQTDYNNDGRMDVFIPRGAWYPHPVRPSLLRNDGAKGFTDVTKEAGLLDPVNSNGAAWADYDNDGWLDLFVCCEQQQNRLYHNRRDGTFEEVSEKAGLRESNQKLFCKGVAWIDFDNDNDPDLFINNLGGPAELHRNNGDGTFTDVTSLMGIAGPYRGFSCWAWDYDNDGWLDIFATCYDRSLGDVVNGLLGLPQSR